MTPASSLDERPTTGLSRTAAGDVVPPARERFRPLSRLEDPIIGWTAAVAVTLLAFFLRVWKLGSPREFEFDETYYAKDAWSMLNHGYVRRLRRQGQRADPRRPHHLGGLAGRPVDGGAPRGRQVADRAGREGVRDGPVRLADRRRRRRVADGAGADPAGTPPHRLDAARLRRGHPALLRRHAPGAVPAGAARHLPGVLPDLRGVVPGRRPGLDPGPDGHPRGRLLGAAACGSGRGWRWPACGSAWPPAPSGRRSTRWPRSGCWCGSGTPAPAAASGSAGRCSRRPSSTAYPRSCTSCWSRSSCTSRRGPGGWCTRTSTSSTSRPRSTPATSPTPGARATSCR